MGGKFGTKRTTRRVKVLETGDIYDSPAECAAAIGGQVSGISKVISGVREHHMGYTFAYVGRAAPKYDSKS